MSFRVGFVHISTQVKAGNILAPWSSHCKDDDHIIKGNEMRTQTVKCLFSGRIN